MNKARDTPSAAQKASIDINLLKHIAVRGAVWVTIISAVAIPLGYLRTWLLSQFGQDGEVLGAFALIVIFIQAVSTFAVPGGSSVLTSFIPKIEDSRSKSTFVVSYVLLSFAGAAFFIAVFLCFPTLRELALKDVSIKIGIEWLLVLVPLIVASEVIMYILSGLMRFRLVALLGQVQLMFVISLAVSSFFFADFFNAQAWWLLISVVGLSYLVVVIIGFVKVSRDFILPSARLYYPPGFWRFTAFIHLNTVCTYVYTNADQIFVATRLGTRELGAYFAFMQCAMLVTFIPQRIGQVMLSSFSHLVACNRQEELAHAYCKLTRLMLLMSTPLTLILIMFSHQIAGIFGTWFVDRHLYLVFLAGSLYIGSLGSINSMLILSKERSAAFFVNSIFLISIQLMVTWAIVDALEVYGIIIGKAMGILVGQIGLFMIIRWQLNDISISPPRDYWCGLIVVMIATVVAFVGGPVGLIEGFSIFMFLFLIFLLLIGIRASEISDICTNISGAVTSRGVQKSTQELP